VNEAICSWPKVQLLTEAVWISPITRDCVAKQLVRRAINAACVQPINYECCMPDKFAWTYIVVGVMVLAAYYMVQWPWCIGSVCSSCLVTYCVSFWFIFRHSSLAAIMVNEILYSVVKLRVGLLDHLWQIKILSLQTCWTVISVLFLT